MLFNIFMIFGVFLFFWFLYRILKIRKDRQRQLTAFENAFKNFKGQRPTLEIGTRYGFPNFVLMFKTASDLEKAKSDGSIDTFIKSIQQLCNSIGSVDKPFDANRAVYTTYVGKKIEHTTLN